MTPLILKLYSPRFWLSPIWNLPLYLFFVCTFSFSPTLHLTAVLLGVELKATFLDSGISPASEIRHLRALPLCPVQLLQCTPKPSFAPELLRCFSDALFLGITLPVPGMFRLAELPLACPAFFLSHLFSRGYSSGMKRDIFQLFSLSP